MESSGQAVAGERTAVIRPAAVLESRSAMVVLSALNRADVSTGGLWNASPTVWQRYDTPWDGVGGTRGSSRLMGTVAVTFDSPNRHEVTIYRVTITAAGTDAGWTVESLCDDALAPAGLTLAGCPRAHLSQAPVADPFKRRFGSFDRDH